MPPIKICPCSHVSSMDKRNQHPVQQTTTDTTTGHSSSPTSSIELVIFNGLLVLRNVHISHVWDHLERISAPNYDLMNLMWTDWTFPSHLRHCSSEPSKLVTVTEESKCRANPHHYHSLTCKTWQACALLSCKNICSTSLLFSNASVFLHMGVRKPAAAIRSRSSLSWIVASPPRSKEEQLISALKTKAHVLLVRSIPRGNVLSDWSCPMHNNNFRRKPQGGWGEWHDLLHHGKQLIAPTFHCSIPKHIDWPFEQTRKPEGQVHNSSACEPKPSQTQQLMFPEHLHRLSP